MDKEIIDNEEVKIMTFLDEEGNKVQLEAIARIYLEEKEYILLSPLDEDSEDVFVFRVDSTEDGKEELNIVEDDKEFLAVKKEYKKLLY